MRTVGNAADSAGNSGWLRFLCVQTLYLLKIGKGFYFCCANSRFLAAYFVIKKRRKPAEMRRIYEKQNCSITYGIGTWCMYACRMWKQ